jgi:hypothetical protein
MGLSKYSKIEFFSIYNRNSLALKFGSTRIKLSANLKKVALRIR